MEKIAEPCSSKSSVSRAAATEIDGWPAHCLDAPRQIQHLGTRPVIISKYVNYIRYQNILLLFKESISSEDVIES